MPTEACKCSDPEEDGWSGALRAVGEREGQEGSPAMSPQTQPPEGIASWMAPRPLAREAR